ncbi:MAG: hypothetical protein AB1545_16045 [Thermodesulfobacteriota bacterium]
MALALVLYLYIFFVSWTGSFVIGEWFPLHVVLLVTAVILYIPRLANDSVVPRGLYGSEDAFICIGLMMIMISAILHPNPKTMNYLMAYFYIFGAGYFALKLLLYKNTSVEKLLWVNMAAVLLVAVFTVTDFLLYAYRGVDIQQFIPRVKPASATYNIIFRRSYGLATEPTILCYYFNTLGPLALWQLWRMRRGGFIIKGVLSSIVGFAWLTTFSAAGVVFMALSVFIVTVIRGAGWIIAKRKALSKKLWDSDMFSRQTAQKFDQSPRWIGIINMPLRRIVMAVLCIAGLLFFYTPERLLHIQDFAEPLVDKVTLTGTSSAHDRMSRWRMALESIEDHPLEGIGPGALSTAEQGSSTNWYLFLTVESGILSIVPFGTFLLCCFARILASNVAAKYWVLVGFISAVLHLTVISTIQHPFLWVLLAIFSVACLKEGNCDAVVRG